MKKIKLLLFLLVTGISGYFVCKYVRIMLEFFKLVKTLPEYLRDMIGVKPKVCFNLMLPKKMELKVGVEKEIKEREKNLEEVIENYINDFYPDLTDMKIKISVYELPDKKKEEKESSDES